MKRTDPKHQAAMIREYSKTVFEVLKILHDEYKFSFYAVIGNEYVKTCSKMIRKEHQNFLENLSADVLQLQSEKTMKRGKK